MLIISINSLPWNFCAYKAYDHDEQGTVAEFLVPDWGDIVDSDIGWLWFRPTKLHRLATISTRQGLRIWPQIT